MLGLYQVATLKLFQKGKRQNPDAVRVLAFVHYAMKPRAKAKNILRTCSPEQRVALVEAILREYDCLMKPSEILKELNARLKEKGYKAIEKDKFYMSRIQKESRVIKREEKGYYSYNSIREKRDGISDELIALLDHFTFLTVMDACTSIILTVDFGYEKIICNLMYQLFWRRNIHFFEGVGCVLIVVGDLSVLNSKEFKVIKETLDSFNEEN